MLTILLLLTTMMPCLGREAPIGKAVGGECLGTREMDSEDCRQCHGIPGYEEGAHGDSLSGVFRLADVPIGDCLHCHELLSSEWFYLFMPYNNDADKRALCFFCHDGVAAPLPVEPPFAHNSEGTTACVSCHDAHLPTDINHGGGSEDCISCHGHDAGFEYAEGQFSMGAGSFFSHSTHTENDADDLRGPNLDCEACHDTDNFPALKSGSGEGPYNLETTDVCDNCHSPLGAYNGVDDSGFGVKYGNGGQLRYNWANGVYKETGILKDGMEYWCISCHDDVPAYSRPDGEGGIFAGNMAGDNTTYGYYVTGHGKAAGNYDTMSWQGASESGNPAAGITSCAECHEGMPTEAHIDHIAGTTTRLRAGYENDQDNSNCSNCHPPGSTAVSDPQFYTESSGYEFSSHGGTLCTDCHDIHGSSGAFSGMVRAEDEALCFQCHTEGMVQNNALSNNRPGGYTSSDDIQQAFGMSEKHNLGTAFTLNGENYSLECVSCHNVHVINGKYWDAPLADVSPVTRFVGNSDGFPVTEIWGDEPGEKMDDFAALGSGSGGWYYSKARGGVISFDQPAVYQPPKSGNGWDFEFPGSLLPDYTTQCLDCHSYRMSDANPPVNWGQGIDCTGNGVDPPDQRVECGAQHGLAAANKPYAWDPNSTYYGSSGNPDPIFNEPYVQRGRGAGQFMRWPYDSAQRNAGINFVMSCTDCHEAHGSNRGSIIRERFNVNANGDCGTGGNSNPDGENCGDGGNWNSYCNACHYYYGYQHAGMSCGNASCHEANSIHRIIHVTESGDAFLWTEPSRPGYTPEIDFINGMEGSEELQLIFTKPVWTRLDGSGSLIPEDFLITNVNGDNPKSVIDIIHTPGDSTATLILSAPLAAEDIGMDLIAALGISVWDDEDACAGPWPRTLPTCPSEARFDFNEESGSAVSFDESGLLLGDVSDPPEVILGDGYFHGDSLDNYIDFTNDTECLIGHRRLALEFMIRTGVVDLDSYDPYRNNTSQTLLHRNASYLLRILRADWQIDNPADPGEASLIFKYKAVDNHGGPNWKQAITDVALYPLLADRWYHILMTFNSDIAGDIPIDMYIDDMGENGDDVGELWEGFPNCTKLQTPDDDWRAREGDEIVASKQPFRIGAKAGNWGFPYMGIIDWIKVRTDEVPASCLLLPDSLDFGRVSVGSFKDTSFAVVNAGDGVLEGEIGESCDRFEIIAGSGFFSLAPGDSHIVAIRYAPEVMEQDVCRVETGTSLCDDVLCLGEGGEPTDTPENPEAFRYALGQNNPNPFNPKTTIHFELAEGRSVQLTIYSVDGRKIRVLLDEYFEAGSHQVNWDGKNDQGWAMPSGTYFYRLQADKYLEMRKMVLIR